MHKKKILIAGVLSAALFLGGGWLTLTILSNKSEAAPSSEEVVHSLAESIGWLKTHESDVLNAPNVMLWRMVRDAAYIGGDPYLNALYNSAYERYRDSGWSANFWGPILAPGTQMASDIRIGDISGFPDYNKFFMYAATCSEGLASEAAVQRQMSPTLCSVFPTMSNLFHPACSTHQLMGFMLMREHRCTGTVDVDLRISLLQQRIVRELNVDFRVTDVYLQRVLMLYWTGAANLVQPVWLNKVLKQQRTDGGWSDQHTIAELWGDQILAFGGYDSSFVTMRQAPSNFHATAQGILLLTLVASSRSIGRH